MVGKNIERKEHMLGFFAMIITAKVIASTAVSETYLVANEWQSLIAMMAQCLSPPFNQSLGVFCSMVRVYPCGSTSMECKQMHLTRLQFLDDGPLSSCCCMSVTFYAHQIFQVCILSANSLPPSAGNPQLECDTRQWDRFLSAFSRLSVLALENQVRPRN